MLVGLAYEVCFVALRALQLERNVALYLSLLATTGLLTLSFHSLGANMSTTKRSMLPPTKSLKREANVSLRFDTEDYQRLKCIAEYRHTTVSNLLFYVTSTVVLPQLEREVNQERNTLLGSNELE